MNGIDHNVLNSVLSISHVNWIQVVIILLCILFFKKFDHQTKKGQEIVQDHHSKILNQRISLSIFLIYLKVRRARKIQSYFYSMCDVHQPVQMNQHQMSLGSNALSERDEVSFTKQVEKKRMLTPYKILIGLAIFCVVAMVSYKLFTLAYAGAAANKITNSHSKFIQNADSSDRDSSSQTGSQSSKSSSSSDRSKGIAKPAGRDVISSSFTGNGGDGDEPSEEDNDGQKRNKKLSLNKMSDGTSTEGDSVEDSAEDEEDDDSDELREQGMIWPNNGGNSLPLVGSTRP